MYKYTYVWIWFHFRKQENTSTLEYAKSFISKVFKKKNKSIIILISVLDHCILLQSVFLLASSKAKLRLRQNRITSQNEIMFSITSTFPTRRFSSNKPLVTWHPSYFGELFLPCDMSRWRKPQERYSFLFFGDLYLTSLAVFVLHLLSFIVVGQPKYFNSYIPFSREHMFVGFNEFLFLRVLLHCH